MDFQSIKLTFNKDKNIGNVIFVVEGEKTEHTILSKVFKDILEYERENISKSDDIKKFEKYERYISTDNENSKVFVVNGVSSNIKSVDDVEYFEKMAELLFRYKVDMKNSRIFYIWDRDHKFNTNTELIKKLISKFNNSLDSDGYDMQGLLLLSYPSIEAYVYSNFGGNNLKICDSKSLKRENNKMKYNQSQIDKDTSILATKVLLNKINEITKLDYNITDRLDDMTDTNMKIFDYQENLFKDNKVYDVLSMLSVALIDLGIIHIKKG